MRMFSYFGIRIRIRMSFIARYIYTYEECVFVTEAEEQNDSDRTKTQITKRITIEQVNRE